jgi:hypothetical protein
MIKTPTTLQDLTTTEELKKLLKVPNLVYMQVKLYIDLTVYDFKELAESGIYGTLKMTEVFNKLDERFIGVQLGTWKAV